MNLRFLAAPAGVTFVNFPPRILRRLAAPLEAELVPQPQPGLNPWPIVQGAHEGQATWREGLRPRIRHRRGEVFVVSRAGWARIAEPDLFQVGLIRQDSVLLTDEATLPLLRMAMFGALARQGFAVLHAAAFEVGGRGVLVLGDSGTGKSTLAALALLLGGRIVSDDSVLVGARPGGGVLVAALRADVVLREAGERLLPAKLRPHLAMGRFDGIPRRFLPRGAVPQVFIDHCTPEMILLPRVDRRRRSSAVRRVSAAEGLAALMAATSPLFLAPELPRFRALLLPSLVALASQAAVYRVALGQDMVSSTDEGLNALLTEGPAPWPARARVVNQA